MTTDAKKRKFHSTELKAKVGLQALAAEGTVNELAQQHKVHPLQVRQWKAESQAQAKTLFEGRRATQVAAVPEHCTPGPLQVGLLFNQLFTLTLKLTCPVEVEFKLPLSCH